MVVEDIDIIEAEPLEALIAAGDQIFARTPLAVGSGPHQITGLAGDHQFVAISGQVLFENASQGDFGRAGFRSVIVGQIEVGDAVVERGLNHFPRILVHVDRTEVVPQSQRHRGQFQSRFAAPPIRHPVVPRLIRPVFHKTVSPRVYASIP
ncbi:hypothetical protein SDC9_195842 [bioreactor metagenome]|uniref:Uncharacterized protein n=1 Tax=bioreactor metagenome TaxID=1076179 RepID=A0A645IA85_9ZZZZ